MQHRIISEAYAVGLTLLVAACEPAPFRTLHFDGGSTFDAAEGDASTAVDGAAAGDASTGADAATGNDTGAPDRWIAGATAALGYKLYVPSAAGSDPLPLVVVLHGCAQSADALAQLTLMNDVAEQQGFYALYPEQSAARESERCWRWYDAAHQHRDTGEPADLVAVVANVSSRYPVDPTRIYVAGLSAGGAMAVILAATYPDVFSAVGTAAGLEYGAAAAYGGIWQACLYGGPSPNTQGIAAYNAMGDQARPLRLIAFHGSADDVVYPVALDQLVAQWAQTNDLVDDATDNDSVDAVADAEQAGNVPGGLDYRHRQFAAAAGQPNLIESYLVDGMGHAWPGGAAGVDFSDPRGPAASALMWQFFSAGH